MNHFQNSERRMFIEGTIFSYLKSFPLFDAVKYAKDIGTKKEYIRITDSLGGKFYLEITDKEPSDIAVDIAHFVLLGVGKTKIPPTSQINDLARKKAIAPLFKVGSEVRYE